MFRQFFLVLIIFFPFALFAQSSGEDYTWWNELHGWEEGDPGWRNYIIMSPGYLGPNALPVPDVKKGIVAESTELEFTASAHFMKGDPTQDISGRLFVPFAKGRIAVELYGVILEHFAFSEEIRNERFARIEDGKGYANGDFYFSTLIQLWKDRKLPDAMLRMACKTASGNQLAGARHTDTPGYFFDVSFSKSILLNEKSNLRPFASGGFYSWQTLDELNLQNDAYMYALGTDLAVDTWNFSASCSGYSGYKEQRDKPFQMNFELKKNFNGKAFRFQYLHGIRDWEYKTFKFSFIWYLKPVN